MFWRKEGASAHFHFADALGSMRRWADQCADDRERDLLLEYFISAIKIDIWGSGLCGIIPHVPPQKREPPEFRSCLPLPSRFYAEEKEVAFEGNTVIATVWDLGKLKPALMGMWADGFGRSKGNYTGNFYPELKLIVITNGMHHSALASLSEQGAATVQTVSLLPSFAEFGTDGFYWYGSTGQNGKPARVVDMRFALLYELARLRYAPTTRAVIPQNDLNAAPDCDTKGTEMERTAEKPTEKYSMTCEENLALVRRGIAQYIWGSARLEGADVTLPQTDAILQEATVEKIGVAAVLAVNNLKHGWQFIFHGIHKKLTLDFICQVNAELARDEPTQRGVLRTGNFYPEAMFAPPIPKYGQAQQELAVLCQMNSPTQRAIQLLLWLARNRLFWAQNLSTALLVANKIMIGNGCGVIAVPLELDDAFHAKLAHFYETHNGAELEEFIFKHCIDGTGFTPYPPCKAE